MTLRMAQGREHQNVLTEALTASNHELGALQQQMVRARSLAHLGEMAAGAAHEMNNPLAVVCGRAQLLAGKLSDPAAKQDAQLIAQRGQRLSQIITDMMEFAKPEKPHLQPIALSALAEQAIADAVIRCGGAEHTPSVTLTAGRDIPAAMLDATQIRKAVVEVLVNALQAAQAGQNAAGAQAVRVLVQHDPLDEQIIIQVIDRGPGMTEATARQAFAPFFSSKPAGRQRGMGLSKALRWVELHGGTIRLDSMPNGGTTAVIILPVNHGAASAADKSAIAAPATTAPVSGTVGPRLNSPAAGPSAEALTPQILSQNMAPGPQATPVLSR